MDGGRNPYTPGSGVRPHVLTGREAQLDAIAATLRRIRAGEHEAPSILIGKRGVGTGVLLDEVARRAAGRGWFVERVDPSAGESALRDAARRVNLAIAAKARIGAARGEASFGELGTVAVAHDAAVLFVIDRFHELASEVAATLTSFGPPVAVVGAGLPTSATSGFAVHPVQPLEEDAAAELLVRTAKREGVRWSDHALRTALDAAEGVPYFLHEIGRAAWEAADDQGRITNGDVTRSAPLAVARLDDQFFSPLIAHTNLAERRYLSAMAALGPPPVRSGDIARRLEVSAQAVAPTRDRLIKQSICYVPNRGELDFTAPQFGDFLRRWRRWQGWRG